MFKILIIEQNERVIRILSENLKKEYNAEVTIKRTATESLNTLKNESDFKIIISRNKLGEDETGKKVLNYTYDALPHLPIIILGDIDFSGTNWQKVPGRFRIEEIFRSINSLLDLDKNQINELRTPDFVSVPIDIFIQSAICPCEVFVRIEKKQVDDQYIKIFHKDHEIGHEILNRYKAKNLDVLYVRKSDRNSFMDSMIAQTNSPLTAKDVSPEIIVNISSTNYNISQTLIKQMGITAHTVELVNSTIKSIANSVKNNSKLGPMLKALLSNKESFAYTHSHLISLFSHGVIANMGWGDDDKLEGHFEKMVFVVFFHDLLLNDDKLVQVNSRVDLYQTDLNEVEKELILNHANKISTLIQAFPKAPLGVDVILRQHHGVSNGVGFTEAFNSNISALAIVFIVLEEFVHKIMKFSENKISITQILDGLYVKFSIPSYRKVVDALKLTIIEGI